MKVIEKVTAEQFFDFYKPHARVRYTGQLVNPVTGEVFTPPRRVKQSHLEECDINNILRQYKTSGQLTHIKANAAMGAYQDLPDPQDFQSALNDVLVGQQAFATLPSKTRDRFGNDPRQFLEFMADPANQEEAIKLGLATDNRGANPPPPLPPAAAAAPPAPEPEKPPKS